MRRIAAPLGSCFLLGALLGCGDHRVVIETASMEPTLSRQERVVVNTHAYRNEEPMRFDVVLYSPPQRDKEVWVHRVIALPTETIAFSNDAVYINGKLLELPRALRQIHYTAIASNYPSWQTLEFPRVIPRDGYFLLGDNAAIAWDSRFNGPVPRDAIFGRVEHR